MSAPSTGLSLADLETVYDTLAETLDAVPAAQRELLLVKLALLQAQALGDAARFAALAATARQDL